MSGVRALYDARVAAGALTADPAQAGAVDALDRLVGRVNAPAPRGWFRKPQPVRGLYLWGGVGRGKSMLMDLALGAVDAPHCRVHFHAFLQWVHARMTAARARGVDDAIAPVAEEIAAEVRLLALDEMQVTDVADAMILGRLFEGITGAGVAVLTTSNRPPRDLYKDGLNRSVFLPFIDLIEDRLEVLELASDTDHRRGRLAGAQAWFVPADRAARAAMDAIWDDLTHGRAHPEVLRVHGRDVTVPAFHAGHARARFAQLCGAALGPADYLALAQAARVLLIDDIPRLSRSNFNEARRFVTLIDALYEARVRLIASAAAEPEMLYVEGEGSFEFARTASRIEEMRSAGWGA
ncbi:MAG: cell division protein ZapE [Paracoccaceae bacterium]